MADLRILVVEDDHHWQEILETAINRAFGEGTVCIAENYSQARKRIELEEFDLISIDLAFDDIQDLDKTDLPGMILLREIRSNPRTVGCALVILSGKITVNRILEAVRRRYRVYDFLDKLEYQERHYLAVVSLAIREALFDQAASRRDTSHKLSISYDTQRFVRSELTGPGVHKYYSGNSNSIVPFKEFARQADSLNASLTLGKTGEWRTQARRLGEDLYNAFIAHPELLEGLTTALTLTNKRPGNLALEFVGPVEGLSFPFELLRSNDYFAMDHMIMRRTEGRSGVIGYAEPFARFVESLIKSHETLRALVVGVDRGGSIPAAEEEADCLADFFEKRLEELAIPHHVARLIGDEATCERVKETLGSGYHIFHFAGHAAYYESLPEGSPLILSDGLITASDLKMALREIDLRMVFLSCCLGARSAEQVGRGDFHGFFHALSESGVPTAIGHRWDVADDSALSLALDFYHVLFRDFCPGRALLRARQNCSVVSSQKRDDPTWASPVLLMDI